MSKDRRKKQIVEDKKHKIPKEKPHHREDEPADEERWEDESPGSDDRSSGDDRGGFDHPSTDFDRSY